jgi:hypothetical protein
MPNSPPVLAALDGRPRAALQLAAYSQALYAARNEAREHNETAATLRALQLARRARDAAPPARNCRPTAPRCARPRSKRSRSDATRRREGGARNIGNSAVSVRRRTAYRCLPTDNGDQRCRAT